MRNVRTLNRSFSGGVMSPEMFGRIDDVRFQNGTAKERNFISTPQGPAFNRPGTEFVRSSKDATKRAILIPFKHSAGQTFCLEFSRSTVDNREIGYIRFHTDAATLQYSTPPDYVAPLSLSGVNLDPTNTIDFPSAHGLVTGDPIVWSVSGGALPTPLVASTIYYAIRMDADTIKVASTRENALALTGITLTAAGSGDRKMHYAYEPGDLAKWNGVGGPFNVYCMGRPWDTHTDHPPTDTNYWYREPADLTYEVPHFYSETALFEMTYAGSNDVLSLAHRDRPLTELRRLGATRWVLANVTGSASIAAPTGVFVTSFFGDRVQVSSVTIANPGVLTLASDLAVIVGDGVYVSEINISPIGGLVNNRFYVVHTRPSATTMTLRDVETGVPIDTTGGATETFFVRAADLSTEETQVYVVTAVLPTGEESIASAAVTATNNLFVAGSYNTITWAAVPGAARYRIYRKERNLYGNVGTVDATATLSFKDDGITPDLGVTPPLVDTLLGTSSGITFDTTNERVNWTAHGLPAGMPILFSTGDTLPTEVVLGTTYYVVNPETNSFQVAATPGGTPLTFLTGGSGSHSASSGYWPSAVGYFEGRRVFGGSWVDPQRVGMTRSGTESDMSYHVPTVDDDRISQRLKLREVSLVQHIVPIGDLLLLTNSSEVRVSPVNSDALTPTSFAARPQTFVGASSVQPAVINGAVVYAAARGGHAREMGYRHEERGYITGDISLRAAHLFDGHSIVQMTYAKAPIPVVWMVSSDGRLLGLTYVPEESIGAWHEHDTDGFVESVAAVSEGDEDRLYMVVRRTINGTTVRHIERMALMEFGEVEDGHFVDDGLTFDGTNEVAAQTVTLTGGSWQYGQTVTLTAAAPGIFTTGAPSPDIGDELEFTSGEATYRVRITGVTSVTVATGTLLAAFPAALQGVATAAWAWARDHFSGLSHLEGKTVSILADGVEQDQVVIVGGAIALDAPAIKVHVGLPITAELQTLPAPLQIEAYGQERTVAVTRVKVRVVDSGNFEIGPNDSSLVPAFHADPEGLRSEVVPVNLPNDWSEGGQVFIRQKAPLPLTVVSLGLTVAVGG